MKHDDFPVLGKSPHARVSINVEKAGMNPASLVRARVHAETLSSELPCHTAAGAGCRSWEVIFKQKPTNGKYGDPDGMVNAINYAKFRSRSHRAVIRVYDSSGNVIETLQIQARF